MQIFSAQPSFFMFCPRHIHIFLHFAEGIRRAEPPVFLKTSPPVAAHCADIVSHRTHDQHPRALLIKKMPADQFYTAAPDSAAARLRFPDEQIDFIRAVFTNSAPFPIRVVHPVILNDSDRPAFIFDHIHRHGGILPRPGTVFLPDLLRTQYALLKIPVYLFLTAPSVQQAVIGFVIAQSAKGNPLTVHIPVIPFQIIQSSSFSAVNSIRFFVFG